MLRPVPTSSAIAFLDVEEPLFAADDEEGTEGSESADQCYYQPSGETIHQVAHASSNRPPTT